MSDPYDSLPKFRSTSRQPDEAADDGKAAEASGKQLQLQGVPDPPKPHTDLCAVLSAIFGVFGLLWLGCLFAPTAVVLGIVSHFRLQDSRRLTGRALAYFGLITGLVMSAYSIFTMNETIRKFQAAGETIQAQQESHWEVRVSTSPEGMPFSGNYMAVRVDGSSESQTVDGVGAATYSISVAQTVSAAFQKQSEFGVLTVELWKDGQQVGAQATSAAYGMVTLVR